MPIEFAEDLLENDNFVVSENGSGDLIQEHKPSGAQFKFDTSLNRWVPVEGLDLDGSDIDNVGSLSTDELSVSDSDARIYVSSSSTTITSGQTTVVPFDSIENEDASVLSVDTSNHTITVEQDGVYCLSANVYWDDSVDWTTGDAAWARIYLNGSRLTNYGNPKTGEGNETVQVQYFSDFSSGDTFDVRINQDSGADQTLIGGSDESLSRFEAWRVA